MSYADDIRQRSRALKQKRREFQALTDDLEGRREVAGISYDVETVNIQMWGYAITLHRDGHWWLTDTAD